MRAAHRPSEPVITADDARCRLRNLLDNLGGPVIGSQHGANSPSRPAVGRLRLDLVCAGQYRFLPFREQVIKPIPAQGSWRDSERQPGHLRTRVSVTSLRPIWLTNRLATLT